MSYAQTDGKLGRRTDAPRLERVKNGLRTKFKGLKVILSW